MNLSQKTAALIELGHGHQECLYSQALFLKRAGYDVCLVINQRLYEHVAGEKIWSEVYPVEVKSSGNWIIFFKLSRYLKKKRMSLVIFNTTQMGAVSNLLFLTGSMPYAGVLHNAQKLVSSLMQRRISRKVGRYFVLNDYLLRGVKIPEGIEVRSFYPIFFPDYPRGAAAPLQPGEFRILIPGQLEFQRRDYRGLIEALSSPEGKALAPEVRFILLGNSGAADGPEIKRLIKERGLQERFTLFDGYLAEADYHDWFRSANLVVPLIHPETGAEVDYLKQNITGAFNLAFAYKKPLLISNAFSGIDDFETSGIFYDNLAAGLQKVSQNRKLLQEVSTRMEAYEKFSFEFQYKNYIELVEKSRL